LSSILKALKKIEEDAPPPQSYPSLPKPIDVGRALHSNTRKRRRWRRLLYWLLILLVGVTATVIVLRQRQFLIAEIGSVGSSPPPTAGEGATSPASQVYRAKVPTASAKPTPKPRAVTRRPRKQTQKKVAGSNDVKLQAATKPAGRRPISGSPATQPASGTRKPEAAGDSRIKPLSPKGSAPPGAAPFKKTVAPPDNRPTAPPTAVQKPVPTKPREVYDRIDNSTLNLQALAWSDDAARRMVVINGRIVHEGESVDGYQVLKIRQEDVVVDRAGKSWRLEFGLQQ